MLKPILDKLEDGNKKLEIGKNLLSQLQAELDACEKKCRELKEDSAKCQKEKDDTLALLDMNKLRLVRARKLLGGLAEEKSRWEDEVKRLR